VAHHLKARQQSAEAAAGENPARERLLGMVLEESLNEIYVFDADSLRFVLVNRGARQNLGYSMDELRELTPLALLPDYTFASYSELLVPLRSGQERVVRLQARHRRKDGSLYPVEAHLQHSRTGDRPVFVAMALDITERARAEGELHAHEERLEQVLLSLRQAKEAAEHANHAKSEFLAAMSHELRTPLNAIAGYLDLLEVGVHGELTGAQRRSLQRIKRNQEYLLRLINSILHFAKIEAGQLEIDVVDFELTEVLRVVLALLRGQAVARGLRYVADDRGGIVVHADPERAQQILLNLIGNAIKFTPSGGTVRVSSETAGGQVLVHVADTGPGISPDRLEAVFDPFYQVKPGRYEASPQGVGLGLAISRDLARSMGGDVTVHSEPGHGSRFTLSLPRA